MRKYRNFFMAICRETWNRTWLFIKSNAPAELIFTSASFIAGVFVGYMNDPNAIVLYVFKGIIFGVIAIIALFVIILVVNFLRAPFLIWEYEGRQIKEKDERINELQELIKASSELPKPNVSLVEAVYYVALGHKWGIDSIVNENREYINNSTHNNLIVAMDDVRHVARSGDLKIWGFDHDEKGNILYDLIENPSDYWRVFWPNEEFFKYNSPEETELEMLFNQYAKKHKAYNWFYVSKQQVEKIWPPKNVTAP